MYHGSKSKSHQWGSWSDWGWDENNASYYRVRQDAEGNLDYDWDPRGTAAAAHAQTPRDTTIGDITESLRGLSTTSYDDGSMPEEHAGKSRSSKSKSKHKHRTYSHDEEAGQHIYATSAAESLHDPQPGQDDYMRSQFVHGSSTAQYYQPSTSDSQTAATYGGTDRSGDDYATGRSMEHESPPDHDHEDAELAASIAASRQYNYSAYAHTGESSSSAYARYDEDEDESPPTPKAQPSLDGYHIAAFEESLEELDPRYRVEPSSKFQPGEIFKVHWSEPQGSSNDGAPSVSGKHEIQNRFGTKFFVGFRRFIVIANDQGHCTCVPILTYGGKACKKKGVKADKHGIIHERGHKARLLEKEPKLGFPPVRVEMKEEGEKLSKESRVNYSKLVTVEHNVKVFFIGAVAYSDWDMVRDAVNHCWNKKNHQKQRHR